MNWLITILLTSLFVHSEGHALAFGHSRHWRTKIYLQKLRSMTPVPTVARPLLVDAQITAAADGSLIPVVPQNQDLAELMKLCEANDFPSFLQLVHSLPFLSESDAFLLYKYTLISEASNAHQFRTEVLTLFRPILLSTHLTKFAVQNTHILPVIFEDFEAEARELQAKLLEECMDQVVDEGSFSQILQFCDPNVPLSNGYPLLFHVIYYQHLPDLFLHLTLSHPRLLLSRQIYYSGEVSAPWPDLPLLLHAWMHREEAFRQLTRSMSIFEIIPSPQQALALFL